MLRHGMVWLALCWFCSAWAVSENRLSWDRLHSLEQEDKQAREIIRQADRIRSPGTPVRYTLRLTEYRNGKPLSDKQQILDISMRFYKPTEQSKNGDARSLVRFVSPARERGKFLLADLDKIWFFAPGLRRPLSVSRQQRLTGQIANGDVVAADFDYAYLSRVVGDEPCGNKRCYKLSLKRRWAWVNYPAIDYWVEKETSYPYRADFISGEGRVIKSAFYQNFQPALGAIRPAKITIYDVLHQDAYTVMEYSDLRPETLPDEFFQKEYLMRLKVE